MARVLTKADLRGIMPPLVTPFTEDEELDIDAFRREIRYMLPLGVRAFVVGGSTGEGHALTAEELATLCGVAAEEVRGRVPLIAGIITTSTRDAIRRGQVAREAGAEGLMITPVIYQIPSDDGMYDYYSAIWQAVGLPILIYNVVPRAPVSPQLLERLVEIPGIIGIKESIGGNLETLSEMILTVGDKIAVTWAQDPIQFSGYALGATGSISGINTVLPEISIKMFEAIEREHLATARELHYQMFRVARAIGMVNWPAGIKAAINLQGRSVGPARRPFIPISRSQEVHLRQALAASGMLQAAVS